MQIEDSISVEKIPIPTVKHGCGNIDVWSSFAASGLGKLTLIKYAKYKQR